MRAEKPREIQFIDGEKEVDTLTFAELWSDALALLGALQAAGMKPADELIIFTRSNRSFVTAFWAAILGGIVPVPVAVGISDEHRLKLFRILGQLERGTLYTEASLLQRLKDFAAARGMEAIAGILENQVILQGIAEDHSARVRRRSQGGEDCFHTVFVGIDQRSERRVP